MLMWKDFRVTLFISFCLSGSVIKNLPAKQETQETWVQSLGQEDPVQKEMATHSNIPAWEIPWTEEPGGLSSKGLQSRTQFKRLNHYHSYLWENQTTHHSYLVG